MVDTSIKVMMVTLDDLKDLEAATDEKAFYKVIKDSWKLTDTIDGVYMENIDFTAEGLSKDEINPQVCWAARDEIISKAHKIFEESHLYIKEYDTEHLKYIKPATYEEMEKAGVKATKNALREVGYALSGLAAQALGKGSFFTITEILNAIKLVSKYPEEEVWNATQRFSSYSYFMKYTGDDMPVLYMTDWGDELRYTVYSLLEGCATEYTADSLSDDDDRLTSFAAFLQSDDFERVYRKADLAKDSFDKNAAQVLGFALGSFIKWAKEQDDATLQSLKTRLAENSALAFDKTFRTSLAEELQKLMN